MFLENTINAFAYPDVRLGYIISGNPVWDLNKCFRLDSLGDIVDWKSPLALLPVALPDRPFSEEYGFSEASERARSRWQSATKYAKYQYHYVGNEVLSDILKYNYVARNSRDQIRRLCNDMRRMSTQVCAMYFIGGFAINAEGLHLFIGECWSPNEYWIMQPGTVTPSMALRLKSQSLIDTTTDQWIYDVFVQDFGTRIRVREHWHIYQTQGGRWLSDGQELYFDDNIDWKSPVVPACRFYGEPLHGDMHSLLEN